MGTYLLIYMVILLVVDIAAGNALGVTLSFAGIIYGLVLVTDRKS